MFIVDRIESNKVILEVGENFIDVPIEIFPSNVCEGDIVNIVIDKKETEKRKEDVSSRLNHLFNR